MEDISDKQKRSFYAVSFSRKKVIGLESGFSLFSENCMLFLEYQRKAYSLPSCMNTAFVRLCFRNKTCCESAKIPPDCRCDF